MTNFSVRILIVVVSIIYMQGAYCNDSTSLVKYTPDFKLTDGVYLDISQFKKNIPVSKARILTSVDYNDNVFFDKLSKERQFSFYNDFGKKFVVPVKSIWGYCDNGVLYINVKGEFFRVTIIGSICHFVAYITTYDYNTYPYYNQYNAYSTYNNPAYMNEKTDLRQFLIDFESGERLDYNIKNLEVLLMKDNEIYEEFVSLRNKKKKQKAFYYLRKFNERNPVYFPSHDLLR